MCTWTLSKAKPPNHVKDLWTQFNVLGGVVLKEEKSTVNSQSKLIAKGKVGLRPDVTLASPDDAAGTPVV